jgi:hypothetical protein
MWRRGCDRHVLKFVHASGAEGLIDYIERAKEEEL